MKKPTMPKVLPLVKAYYAKPGNEVGGCLRGKGSTWLVKNSKGKL